FIKVATGFSWIFSPRDSSLKQAVYFLSYFPILILGILGAISTRKRWRELMPVYLLFLSFIAGTAIYWAHTSHRSFLDVYLILFAAGLAGVFASKKPEPILTDSP
ncbi:MAG: hypothetical protein H7070_06185, partial [Saprospiraceae bacterium]|nr:hypothetical protein [Pyrinomonadaceae bacterium]